MLTKKFLLFALVVMAFLIPASGQTNIFNCPSFASTGACSVVTSSSGNTGNFISRNGAGLSGSVVDFIPYNSGHNGYGLFYVTQQDIRAFTTTFTFNPNGQNIAFVVQNTNNTPGYQGHDFASGAGCEGGFYQTFTSSLYPNNVFALELEGDAYLNPGDSAFTYSSVQIYMSGQSPCSPNDTGSNFWPTTKFSTSPVPLNSPSDKQGVTTGDTYLATVNYDGSNLTLSLADITLGNVCPGLACYTHTWSNVRLPSLVGATTAYVGFTGGINLHYLPQLSISQWAYTVNTPTATPTSTPPVAGGNPAANPTFTPAAGTYTGAQLVTLASPTSGAYFCYALAPAGLVITPLPDNFGNCAVGTLYTGPVSVPSSETLYAITGTNVSGLPSGVAQAPYIITQGGTAQVATPTFSPTGGTYTSAQLVTLSDTTSGATIYYTTDGSTPTTSSIPYTGPFMVGTTETLQAIAVAAGDTNSAVASAAYTITPTVATPGFSPGAGVYSSAQTVTMSDATPGATIYYTTNGSTPTTSSIPYTGAIMVGATETLKAVAVATGDTNSAVASATYTINLPTVATPTLTPAGGTFTSAQTVTMSDTTSGATIYYTTNGSTPTTSSIPYTGAITVSSTETLQAIAVASDDTNSAVASATFTITPVVATPAISPAGGSFTSAQTVTMSDSTSGATIYYTTNGSTPTTSSIPYTGAITVSATETLQAIAVASGDTNSAVASATFTITPVVATPAISPAGGTFTSAQTVTMSDTTSGATIYYTTNGSTPTTSSIPYTGAITVSSTETLQAIAVLTGDTNSSVASASYTINLTTVATPTLTPAGGTFTSTQTVTMSDTTSGATIYYTTNGSTPTTSSIPYTGAITVSSTETLQAMAVASGDTNSAVATATYTINPVVATPAISPAGGTFTSAQTVTMSDTTSGATIYYTTNGSTPTTSSIPYTGAITVSSTETLQAMAVATGDTNSAVASATYTINPVVATPAISPAGGSFTSAQTVTMSDTTSGATIYYTTNGSTPTTSSIPYTGAITVSATETLQAMAVATGDTNSPVASATYTISAQTVVATPTFSPAAGTYTSAQTVTLSDTTSGATIYYTTNGTTPTTSSIPFTSPFMVSATETIEAIAVATGDTNSTVASAAYTVNAASAQATNFAIGTTVQQSPVKHLGINLGGQNFYDSGQLSRNLTVRNPGFEAEIWSSILNCQAATATTCTDSDPNNTWTANFLQGASFQFLYGAAKGQSGTVSANTGSSSGASTNITLTFSAPLSPAPASGDVVQVQMQVPGNPQAGWWTTGSGGATFSADTNDLSPETPGKQALSINAAGSGQSAQVSSYFDTSTGRSFVLLNGTYTVTFRAKAVSGSNQIVVSVGRNGTPAHAAVSYLNQNVTLTSQWQDYSYTFNAAEDGTYVGSAFLTFSIAGAQVYLDDVALTEPAAANNPTVFRNAVVETLQNLQPGVLRYMDPSDFASNTDNMIAVPFARLRAGYDEGQTEQDDISIGLHDFLVLCQTVGAEPWYTVPGGTSPADMQNLIQYLAGAASTPYGAKRATLGQSAPWTSIFPTIHLELGNEMWNGLFAGEAVPNNPVAYGNIAATAFAAARASAAYNPANFDLVLGSWATQPTYTNQVLTNSSGYDSVDVAPYLFNSLNDYGSNEAIFGPMFAQPEQVDSSPTASGNYMFQQGQQAANAGTPAKLAVYEVNLSTTAGTAPQNVVTQTAAGLGAGLAVADHMLLMMRDLGVTTQNMFALPEYSNAFANSATETVPLWGSVIDMGGETNLKRPQFLAEQLANSAILPKMLATTVSGANPTWNQPQSTNDQIQLANAHYLQSFAFTNGTQHSVVVFNLSRTASLPVTFSGSNAPSGNVVISQLTSANLTDNNEGLSTNNPVVAGPTQTNVSNFNPATAYSLPQYSMTVFSWPGAILPGSTTLLQATPTAANTGQTVTLTATVSGSGTNTPTGSVTFLNGSTTLGLAVLNASGVAVFTTTTLPLGTDAITAAYGGDANDAGSTSAAVTVTITSGTVASTTTLTASATAITAGQNVTFTATVAPQSGSNSPTGTVTFKDGSTTLGTGQLNGSGVATYSTTSLAAGTHSITATYGGDSKDFGSTSTAVSVAVTQGTVASTTTLAASATQIASGQSVTFTATVMPQTGSNVPTGTVTFKDGTTALGTAKLNSKGVATFSTAGLAAGTQSITASYGGDGKDYGSISQVVSIVVTAGSVATTTTLSTSASQITFGQSVTFTATVTPKTGSTMATGPVNFLNGTTNLGTGKLNGSGVATFTTTALPAGTESITASYPGDSQNAGSVSAPVTVTVTGGTVSSSTTLAASATQITLGQSVTFTATVTPQSGSNVPTGTITFKDGAAVLGTAKLNGSGVATFSTTALTVGTQVITASYGGDGKDYGSISPVVGVVVVNSLNTPATTIALSASATNVTSGQNVTFTATVATQGSNIATGTVTFLDGANSLGTSSLNASGVATFSTTALAAGTHSIVASYAGDSNDSGSFSAAVSVTVTAIQQGVAITTTTLTASSDALLPSDSVTFTAMVAAPGGGVPTGTVAFYDGSNSFGGAQLNASGVATLTVGSLSLGAHSITASYGGDANNAASTSAVLIVSVSAPQYAMVVSANNLSLAQGQPSSLLVTLIPENGFNAAINLTCSGLPAGTTCTFTPSTVTPNGAPAMSTVTLMSSTQTSFAPKQAPAGPFGGGLAFGWVMPWGFIPLLGWTQRRSRIGRWSFRLAMAAALTAGSLWVSGCASSAITGQYVVTLTSSAANAQTHTSQITVTLQK